MVPPVAICSISLGRPHAGHALLKKMRAAAKAGFQAMEITFVCLEDLALTIDGLSRDDQLREAARRAKALADELGLELISLAPLMNYEGHKDRSLLRFSEAKLWVELAGILGASMFQIPACMHAEETLDYDLAVQDIREISAYAAEHSPPVQVLYEFTSFSTLIKTWQDTIAFVRKVDHPNLKICLDTYHFGSLLFSTPHSPPSINPGPNDLANSLKELSSLTPEESKIFPLFQLSDAMAWQDKYHDPEFPDLMMWSRNLRNPPFEEEGLFPMVEIIEAVKKAGFSGRWSIETFVPEMLEKRDDVPEELAARAWKSWTRLNEAITL
ncbi:3-dehydroshikimate dehydratase [Pseudohyphozyma bogoriensis]|nr:3-dehydroshikimate dehydratase [Pseudohyphozyma bogoriensis]